MYQKTKLYEIFRRVGLVLLVIWAGFPVFVLITSAFKPPDKIFAYPPTFIFNPTLQNFFSLVRDWPQFFDGLFNSLVVSFGAALFTVLLAAPAGYAFSRYKSKILEGSAFFMLAVRMYPPIVLTVPLYPIFSRLGLVDTYWVLIILYSTFFVSLSSWLMKTFIDEVDIELEEAAAIDGASRFQIITRIIIPLSIHGIVATAIFVLTFAWKEYMFAYIFTGSNSQTAPIVLEQMLSPVTGVEWGPLFAAAVIQLIPILVFILLVQNYLIKGLSAGGVKG